MSRWTAFALTLFIGLLVACSDVGFQSIPKITCDSAIDTDCVVKGNDVTLTFSFRIGEVDILFVDDNSGSMSVEQSKMATAFPQLFNKISNLFYQVAIITTDVSASPGNSAPRFANGNGAFQDGKFLEFHEEKAGGVLKPTGEFILTNETANKEAKFRGTIKRPETKYCDDNDFKAEFCPSSDERGIYALNLAVERDEKDFFRPGAHLAVVILSDEDERSFGGTQEYPLELKDLPETFVLGMQSKFPTKSISVHSVIVKPNDSACLAQQNQTKPGQTHPTFGQYGKQYAKLSTPSSALKGLGNIVTGNLGTICTNFFDAQMGDIGAKVKNNTLHSPKQLLCDPKPNTIVIETVPAGRENEVSVQIDSSNKLTATGPIGVEVFVSYDCPRF